MKTKLIISLVALGIVGIVGAVAGWSLARAFDKEETLAL